VVMGSGRLCRGVEMLLRMELTRDIPEVLGSRPAVACDRSQSVRFNRQLVIDMRLHSAADGVAHVIFKLPHAGHGHPDSIRTITSST
jgi:hypothetical protein